ncbi:class I SAM-dependent methyltransferase [Undibacterium squillarum]|uniref:Methyltransferase type 11 domain-containing protein n=1 Tax=Undibacterium squillarum TaxID=1131567 RepID=A0ABQ2XSU8_9BURK|nr:class I SAM-dependent methyltransferase [Undibacterium squillarum]GGX32008.1 hypothetical protein GCM10010946_06490 [Undibacterium squillarum]
MEKHIIDLDAWLQLPAGQYVKRWEENLFDQLTPDIFGYHALQVGLPQIDALRASRMPHRWIAQEEAERSFGNPRVAVLHDFAEFPFASQSLDLVVLPHVLEFAEEPHQILREVERILIPEGRVIISGFNRASLWGMRQATDRLRKRYYLPKEGEFISPARLRDWMKLLNMEVSATHFGCYAPPFRSEKWLQRYQFTEKAGTRWWPVFGAVYVMEAVKRVRGMHLIGPAWKKQRARRAQAVPAVNQVNKQTHE